MKRFIRYFIYRELYRWIRQAGESSRDNRSSQSLDPDKPADHLGQADRADPIPIEEGPIETVGELQTVLQQMDPYEFEHFIADLWERMGWSAEVSSAAMDEGLDVIARKSTPYDQRVAIQAKRYGPNTTVGSPDIQQYASLLHQYDGIDKVLVVTTNEFTGQARDLAERLNVKLINGTELAELVGQYQALDLVAEYINFVEAVENEPVPPVEEPEEVVQDEINETSEEGRQAGQRAGDVPDTIWEKVVMFAIPGWIVAFFGINWLPEVVWGLLFFTVWFGLPIALYLDARIVREEVSWPKRTWAYVLTSFIWLLAIIPAGVYVWKRRSLEDSSPGSSTPAKVEAGSGLDESHPAGPDTTEHDQSNPETSESTEAKESEVVETQRDTDDLMHVTYHGDRYFCQTSASPNGEYIAAYKDGSKHEGEPEPGRVFLLDNNENLQFTTEIGRPNRCAVANDGTMAVVDWNLDWGDELSGTFHVFTSGGQRLLRDGFDSNLGPCAITEDGEFAATSTLNPDCSTYIYDAKAGELLTRHENQHGNVQQLSFKDQGGNRMLRLGERDGSSAYGIDFAGHVVWKSEQLRQKERLDVLLDSADKQDLEVALKLLGDASELASEDWEVRRVARQMADAHWNLAREIKSERGITDDWWEHMSAAYQSYLDTLPWYDGKQGAAKTQRALGKQYLKDDENDAARECFEEIARLEEEYDVLLLTDADERRLQELSSDGNV